MPFLIGGYTMYNHNLMLLEHHNSNSTTAADSAAEFHKKGDRLDNVQIAVIIALRHGGFSISEIKKRCNVAEGTIGYWCNPKERKRKLSSQRKAPKKIATDPQYKDWINSSPDVAGYPETPAVATDSTWW